VIGALLARGEGPTTEFKRQLPDDFPDSKRKVFKTVSAFANGQGGSIVFAVESEATVCGLADVNMIKERDRLAQLAWTLVTPSPVVEVRAYEVTGKTLLVLFVKRGDSPPYGLTQRDGSSTTCGAMPPPLQPAPEACGPACSAHNLYLPSQPLRATERQDGIEHSALAFPPQGPIGISV
jgi:hypothetical protein